MTSDCVFQLKPGILYEIFDDVVLVFQPIGRMVIRLDRQYSAVLARIESKANVAEVSSLVAHALGISATEATSITAEALSHLVGNSIIEPAVTSARSRCREETMIYSVSFVKNPDVVLREEEEDGALLFNPDTGDVLVLNTTAAFIWGQCDGKRTVDEIVESVNNEFEGSPTGEVQEDVLQFVEQLVESGFLGTENVPTAE